MSRVLDLLREHESYRATTLNLIPSENVMSETARRALSSDLVHRYTDSDLYAGTCLIDKLISLTRELACRLFRVEHAFVEPLSGNLCLLAVLLAFTKSGDAVAALPKEHGGYSFRYADFERRFVPLPFDEDTGTIDVEKAKDVIARERPRLVVLGASRFLFPHPVRELAEFCEDLRIPVVYDGSHVMGLIAGGEFQDPLREGALVLFGSTHKTLPGPQGGLILTNDEEAARRIAHVVRRPPLLVDNPHIHRIAALGVTLEEMLVFGRDYARAVVRNASRLARELHKRGLPVAYAHRGFTRSHQIWVRVSREEGLRKREVLERARIIVDSVIRIGTQEVTRLGMGEREMIYIAELIARVWRGESPSDVARDVIALRSRFRVVHYSFDAR